MEERTKDSILKMAGTIKSACRVFSHNLLIGIPDYKCLKSMVKTIEECAGFIEMSATYDKPYAESEGDNVKGSVNSEGEVEIVVYPSQSSIDEFLKGFGKQ